MTDRDAVAPTDGVSAVTAERLIRTMVGPGGHRVLPWAAGPLLDARRVLDVCCGTGPLADELQPGRWLGVDPGAPAMSRLPRLRAAPPALPLRANSVDGIALLLALPRLTDLDRVFAELRRVLRPGGTLVVIVPSAVARSPAELLLVPLLAGVHRGWTHRSALDRAGWLLAAADFAVVGDDRVPFALPVPDAAAAYELVADLPQAGLWPPDLPSAARMRIADGLARRSSTDSVLPVPLRRLVARR